MDQGAKATHDPYPPIHTLIHTLDPYPRSIPQIHTPDPYPFLVEERLMLAVTMLFILIYTASGRRTATPIATTVAFTAASTASAAAAAATTSDYPPRSCCYCSCWSCSRCWCWLTFSVCFGSWTTVTSWLATRNIASAPWRLVRPVLLPLGAYCTSSGAMTTTPSVSTLPGTCRTKKAWCPDPYPDPDPFHAWSISEPSHGKDQAENHDCTHPRSAKLQKATARLRNGFNESWGCHCRRRQPGRTVPARAGCDNEERQTDARVPMSILPATCEQHYRNWANWSSVCVRE